MKPAKIGEDWRIVGPKGVIWSAPRFPTESEAWEYIHDLER